MSSKIVDNPESLLFRKATSSDEDLLLNWANNPETRKNSFNPKAINPGEHQKWFKSKLDNPKVLMWILEELNTPVGLVRLEKEEDVAVLNYLIAPDERGKGLACKMLKISMEKTGNCWGNIRVLAYTVPQNMPSIKTLIKSGFSLMNSTAEKKCYVCNLSKIINPSVE